MSLRYEAITNIFTKLGKEVFEIWFSGKVREGEYKEWHKNGQMYIHSFYKNDELEGEYKAWHPDGQLIGHSFWKDGEVVRNIK